MKFAADKMLGRLAKWLRIIGQDVAYGSHLSGYGLVRNARREGRLILTRDRALIRKNPPDYLFIGSDQFREQLKQVIETCRLDPWSDAFTRCLECNTPLESIEKESVRGKVPSHVYSTQEGFSSCRRCGRVYWRATHHAKILEELKAIALRSA